MLQKIIKFKSKITFQERKVNVEIKNVCSCQKFQRVVIKLAIKILYKNEILRIV